MPGATPVYALPFPIAADRLDLAVTEIPEDLALQLESVLLAFGGIAAPTAWVGLTFAANWANVGFGWTPTRYRKVGAAIARVEIATTRSVSASGANAVIGTLPVGFRPTAGQQPLPGLIATGAAVALTQLSVATNGDIVTSISVPSGSSVLGGGYVSLD